MTMSVGDFALNEARAMRLVLACLRAGKDDDVAAHAVQMVYDEIDCCPDCDQDIAYVIGVLASMLAEDMAIKHGSKKAMRKLEKDIAFRLDFAARGASADE